MLRFLMPTVLRFGGIRVAIYPNDHRPPHVHAIGNGREAVFELMRAEGVRLRENYGFSRRDLADIEEALIENLDALIDAWENMHG
jgi:hypothetical protein